MRELTKVPGSGFRVTASGRRLVKLTLTLPGANALNLGGSKNNTYKRELHDLRMGGARDARWIAMRWRALIPVRFRAAMRQETKRRVS
jgi:hypothetical protein